MDETTTPPALPVLKRGEDMTRMLAGYAGPSYRKIYLSRLLRSGLDHAAAGNIRTAEYCLGKVEAELVSASHASSSGAKGEDSDSSRNAEADASPRRALERVRSRWREEKVRRTESVLDRHGLRLSSLERKVYRESLVKWSNPSPAGTVPGHESRADSALQELRRRLYGRILKTQKSVMVRRRGSGSVGLPAVTSQHTGPVGPYNDRYNLEGVIRLLDQADSTWVEEFLELYRGLDSLRGISPGT